MSMRERKDKQTVEIILGTIFLGVGTLRDRNENWTTLAEEWLSMVSTISTRKEKTIS